MNLRLRRVLVLVFADAVQGVDVDEKNIVILVNQFDELLHHAVRGTPHEASELSHSVVDVHHVVAHLQGIELRDGHALAPVDLVGDGVAVVAVENLVVGVEGEAQGRHDEPAVQGERDMAVPHMFKPHGVEDVFESLHLDTVFGQDIGRPPRFVSPPDVVGEQFEVFVEPGLRRGAEVDVLPFGRPLGRMDIQRNPPPRPGLGHELFPAGHLRIDGGGVVEFAEQFRAYLIEFR